MKRKISFAVGIVATISILAFGVYYSSASQVNTTMTTEEISNMVTAQYPGEITKIEKETEANQPVYAVDLINEEKGYDLQIDANSGEVLEIKEKSSDSLEGIAMDSEDKDVNTDEKEEKEEKSKNEEVEIKEKDTQKDTKDSSKQDDSNHQGHHMKDHKNHKKHKNKKNHKEHHSNDNHGNMSKKHHTVISVEEAKEIALREFSGEIDDVDLEKENGRLIYEIEIERGDQEAEIEIDAYTGEIIKIEIDED